MKKTTVVEICKSSKLARRVLWKLFILYTQHYMLRVKRTLCLCGLKIVKKYHHIFIIHMNFQKKLPGSLTSGFLTPRLISAPPVMLISIPVQNVASAAKYRQVSPHSSGVPWRPSNCNGKKTRIYT